MFQGDLTVSTAGAGIVLADVGGDVAATTSDAGIQLERVGRNKVQARTRNGNNPRRRHARHAPPGHEQWVDRSEDPLVATQPRSTPGHHRRGCARRTAGDCGRSPLAEDGNDRIRRTWLAPASATCIPIVESVTSVLNGGGGLIEVTTANGPIEFALVEPPPTTQAAH